MTVDFYHASFQYHLHKSNVGTLRTSCEITGIMGSVKNVSTLIDCRTEEAKDLFVN